MDELGVEGAVPPPEPIGVDVPGLLDGPPPPQLWSANPKVSTRHTTPNLWIPLRPPSATTTPTNGNSSAHTAANVVKGDLDEVELATDAEVEIVRVALAEADAGVIEAGEKLHVAPLGNPEQDRATALLNAPFWAATLML